jgi:conjugative relaxase-like TrwC/TraI family protein
MLSIGSIKSASGAASYYASDNYYTKGDAQEASEWFGKGASALGLEGRVEPSLFEAVLAGKLPNGEQIAAGGNGKRCGFDLTFSAPKSLSLIALVGGDTRLIEAHRNAVKATLSFAEQRFAAAGQGKQGRETVFTGNLVVALFQHDTSRARDPQVHSHAVIANVTQRPDGAWRALKNDQLYAENKLLGALYHNELRTRVAALGYGIDNSGKNGMFEIAGISRATIEAWSTRSAEIKAIAKRIGATSPEAKGQIALRSRGSKEDIAPQDLRAAWQNMAEVRGENFAAMIATPTEPAPARNLLDTIKAWGEALLDRVMPFWRPQPEPLVQAAGQFRQAAPLSAAYAAASAVRHLGERDATFRSNDVLREALNFAEQKAGIAQIESQLAKLIEQGALVAGKGNAAHRLTTPDMIATEKAIVAFAKAGLGQIAPQQDSVKGAELIQTAAQATLGFGLRDEQLKAATVILYGPDKVTIVQGDSGTGKSTLFSAINAVADNQRPALLMLTTQSGLARELEAQSGIKTHTLARFLTHYEQLAATSRSAIPTDKAEYNGKTLIIDEASMVSSRQMHGLFKIADKLGIERIALVGDAKQIPAVEAGRPFALLQERLDALTLTENVRQRDPIMREIVAKLGAGDVRGAFALLESRNLVSHDPARTAAELWLKLDKAARDTTEIYTSGHRLRYGVLDTLKEGQGADRPSITLSVFENLNKTKEEMRHAGSYAPGQRLDLFRRQAGVGLDKGSYQVVAVDPAKGQVTVEALGKQSIFEPQRLHHNASGLSLSIPKAVTLHEGERIMATANLPKRGVANGDQFILKSIEGERLRIEGKDGQEHLLERGDPLRERLDHAGALNMHRAQGQTAENAITVLSGEDRLLNSQSLVYVLASRARDGFILVVDDKERVIEQIERNDGNKPHATTLVEPERQNPTGLAKAELPPVGLSDELREKLQSSAKEPDLTNTLPVPQKQLGLEL